MGTRRLHLPALHLPLLNRTKMPIPQMKPGTYALPIELLDLASTVFHLTAVFAVFRIAGGDWATITGWAHHLISVPPAPLAAAATAFLGIEICSALGRARGGLKERRLVRSWYVREHPADSAPAEDVS